jgi:hypothetical protein
VTKKTTNVILAATLGVAVCGAVFILSGRMRGGDVPQRVVIYGSASPAPSSNAGAGLQPVGPFTYSASGALTVGVGDLVDSNGLQVGVVDLVAPYPAADASSKPSRGQFLLVKAELHNSHAAGDAPLTISKTSSFELSDASGQVYQPVSVPGAPEPIDGRMAPGQTLDGAFVYDVPSGQSYAFHFKDDAFTNGEIIVDLGRH